MEERVATVIVGTVVVLWIVFFVALGYFGVHHTGVWMHRG